MKEPVSIANAKIEDIGTFQEKRSALGQKRLEYRKVYLCRVCFDLTEIWVYGRVQREIACEAIFNVQPRSTEFVVFFEKRIVIFPVSPMYAG